MGNTTKRINLGAYDVVAERAKNLLLNSAKAMREGRVGMARHLHYHAQQEVFRLVRIMNKFTE